MVDDADIVVVAYGASSRVARSAVNAARAEGIKAGLIRPITLWPFPTDALQRAAQHVKKFLAVEMSMGQMVDDVRLAIHDLKGRCSVMAVGLKDQNPGCTLPLLPRMHPRHQPFAEVMDGNSKAIGVAPVGCAVMNYDYFACDMVEAPHGRAPAVATGIKRARPENVVFTYQGDGDLAAIGTAETVHAATRGENITVIFVNNAIYGMTGGQMAPTSLPNQVTQTTPYGRDVNVAGYPVRVCEMLSTLDGVALAQRVTVDCVKNVNIAKKAIKKAFQNQIEGKGFSIVEVVSTCPTNWGLSPIEALQWLRDNIFALLSLGRLQGQRERSETA